MELMNHTNQLDPRFRSHPEAGSRITNFMASRLDDENSLLLVALLEDQVVGYILARVMERPPVLLPPRFGFISDLVVTKPYRRRGIGTRLFQAALGWLQAQGITAIHVNVAAANAAAEAFWRKMGFTNYIYHLRLDTQPLTTPD